MARAALVETYDMPGEEAVFLFRPNSGRARMRCPHCNCAATCRTSRQITPTYRELYYECTNLFCGCTFHSSESIDYILVPSAIPDPSIDIPVRPMPRQKVMDMLRDKDPNQPDMFDSG